MNNTPSTRAALVSLVALAALCPALWSTADNHAQQVIFPGQAHPRVSAAIIAAYDHALKREYSEAHDLVIELGRQFPDNPAGPTGEMVLYQVMMLENDDYNYDSEFRDAARRCEPAAKRFADSAEENDWYYTLLGAAWGIQGIYFLRQDEYLTGGYYGLKGLYYMQTAADMNPRNWEARMGIGLYLYYRSAYARFIPIPWLDQREKGIAMIEEAGRNRPYLQEVSRIALCIIYMNEKDYERAKKIMDGLISERPYFPIFYQFGGRAMMESGDYAAARDYYQKMRQIDPGLYLPCYKLGECALAMGDREEARRWFEEFFEVLGDRESIYRKPAARRLKELG